MENLLVFLQRTVGQKVVVGLTGLGLCLFVLIHSAGNLLILGGPERYNLYAHSLHEFFLMTTLEIGLLVFFAGHILLSLLLIWKNRLSAGEAYKYPARGEKKTPFSHTFLALQAVTLLGFLVWHLLTFKFGPYYETSHRGQVMRDIYRLVVEVFQSPLYVAGYSLALLILFIHLNRGIPAALRSLGLTHPGYTPYLEKGGFLFSALVVIGFLAPPFYIYFIL